VIDAFEDHCWQDVVPAEMLEGYSHYRRKLFVGPAPALLAIDLYELAYQGGAKPVAEVARERDLWVLSDEIYSRYLYGGRHHSIASLPGMKERTILLDGHSKTYAMTGWRLGYAAAPPELVERLTLLVTNSVSCAASFTQMAGVEALDGPQDAVEKMIGTYRERRDFVVAGLNQLPGVRCGLPEGAFYAFPNVTEACARVGAASAEELQRRLLDEAGVALLSRTHFGSRNEGETEEYLRLSFTASIATLEEGLKRFSAFLK